MSLHHSQSRRAVPLTRVAIDDDFWSPRIEVNRSVTLEHQWRMLDETGRIRNFERAAARETGGFEGQRYNDSDVYKWMEAAAHALAQDADGSLRERLDDLIEKVAAAQEDDGYLDTWYQLECPDGKWNNLGMGHELYCAGHLIEAAIAHHQSTGERRLLDVALRLIDHIERQHGAAESNAIPGHQEIELALVSLARHLDEPRFLQLAQRFLERRGQRPSRFEAELDADDTPGNHHDYRMLFLRRGEYDGSYAQDHLPLWEQTEAVGHAVRAMYQYCAMTEVADLEAAPDKAAVLDQLWECVTGRRMYLTGGLGSSRHNEGFTTDHDLPSRTAYAETCAAIGLVFWAHRMFLRRGDSACIDVMERALYNGVLAGVSLDGRSFFYENPLESRGDHHRQEWFDCSCCPPNVSRLLQSLGRYVAAESSDTVWLNLFVSGRIEFETPAPMTVHVTTAMPWSGRTRLRFEMPAPAKFTLALRRPAWSLGASVTINDDLAEPPEKDGYLQLRREYRDGDVIDLSLAVETDAIAADPAVSELAGRIALQRGPLVYCFEGADHVTDTARLFVDLRQHQLDAAYEADTLGGVVVLRMRGLQHSGDTDPARPYTLFMDQLEPTTLTAVPYHVWGHRSGHDRTGGGMAVWLPVRHP